MLPGGEVDGSIQQALEVGLAPLTTTPNDVLGEIVPPCHCTLRLLGPGPQRERMLLLGYTARVPLNFKVQLLPSCSHIYPGGSLGCSWYSLAKF